MQTEILARRLHSINFLRGVGEDVLINLAQQAEWKIYPVDAVIFWEGDVETHLFYLQYGWLKVIKTAPDGHEQILRYLGPGEIFNQIGVFTRRPNPARAMALEEAGIWRIPRHALEQVLYAHPHTALQIMENMADRFIDLTALTADISRRTVEARLAKHWLEQAKDGVIPRHRWSTLTELAAHLGTVPDVLSRVIRELTKAGLVEVDNSKSVFWTPKSWQNGRGSGRINITHNPTKVDTFNREKVIVGHILKENQMPDTNSQTYFAETTSKAIFDSNGPKPQFLIDTPTFKTLVVGLGPVNRFPSPGEEVPCTIFSKAQD